MDRRVLRVVQSRRVLGTIGGDFSDGQDSNKAPTAQQPPRRNVPSVRKRMIVSNSNDMCLR